MPASWSLRARARLSTRNSASKLGWRAVSRSFTASSVWQRARHLIGRSASAKRVGDGEPFAPTFYYTGSLAPRLASRSPRPRRDAGSGYDRVSRKEPEEPAVEEEACTRYRDRRQPGPRRPVGDAIQVDVGPRATA